MPGSLGGACAPENDGLALIKSFNLSAQTMVTFSNSDLTLQRALVTSVKTPGIPVAVIDVNGTVIGGGSRNPAMSTTTAGVYAAMPGYSLQFACSLFLGVVQGSACSCTASPQYSYGTDKSKCASGTCDPVACAKSTANITCENESGFNCMGTMAGACPTGSGCGAIPIPFGPGDPAASTCPCVNGTIVGEMCGFVAAVVEIRWVVACQVQQIIDGAAPNRMCTGTYVEANSRTALDAGVPLPQP